MSDKLKCKERLKPNRRSEGFAQRPRLYPMAAVLGVYLTGRYLRTLTVHGQACMVSLSAAMSP